MQLNSSTIEGALYFLCNFVFKKKMYYNNNNNKFFIY